MPPITPRQRYRRLLNSQRWRTVREQVLARDKGLCQDCVEAGRLSVATEVHHVQPVEHISSPALMMRLALDPANLVALCHSCHVGRHRSLGKWGADAARARAAREDESFARLLGL